MATPPSEAPRPRFVHGYQRGTFRAGIARAIFYGGAVTGLIMFILPFTQMLSNLGKEERKIRSFDIAPPPPPPPPEIEEPPEEPPPEEPPPQMSQPPPPMSLSQLELALNPGIGDAMGGGFGFGGFDVQPDAAADIGLFDVADLDELPRPVGNPTFQAPGEARRERIPGRYRFEVEIGQDGRTRVTRTLQAEPERFRQHAIDFVQSIRWTPPRRNGEPVRARYIVPVQWNIN